MPSGSRYPGRAGIFVTEYQNSVNVLPCFMVVLCQQFFSSHDAHFFPGIWKILPAIEAAYIIETCTVTLRPRSVAMDAAKEVGPNPLRNSRQPVHVCPLKPAQVPPGR